MGAPQNLRYTKDHEWARLDDDVVTVGITAYAQDQLGDIVYVEAPEAGARVAAHETFGTVESTKSVSDLVSPVTGTVSETNDRLVTDPAVMNSDPYGEGWIMKVAVTNPSELQALMTAEAYEAYVGSLGH